MKFLILYFKIIMCIKRNFDTIRIITKSYPMFSRFVRLLYQER